MTEGLMRLADSEPFPKRYALLCTGQASQFPGMGLNLFTSSKMAREVFEQADGVMGFAFSKLMFNEDFQAIHETINAQPAIVITTIAHYAALQEKHKTNNGRDLPIPSTLFGHSLGELTAMHLADMIDLPTAIYLAKKRGEYMAKAPAGAMYAVRGTKIDERVIMEICEAHGVGIALYNSSKQIVISGDEQGCSQAALMINSLNGISAEKIKVSIAGHSLLMKEAQEQMAEECAKIDFKDPTINIMLGITGDLAGTKEDVVQGFLNQMTSPVRFRQGLERLHNQAISFFYEVGPKPILSVFVAQTFNAR